ncbi:hypothetical protein [Companilactobacillus paralimentarius]|uniref:hypothetical protein n=1 Tax=Companilactobacillus paralimentarius TaxID=83526 RepID=UPI001265F3BC|nr:hypothetical protein [Companilactobacillus paralimentarius]QFR68457.1 hypothetical protein LP238_00305 [Companilactobacillus paralimentarius]
MPEINNGSNEQQDTNESTEVEVKFDDKQQERLINLSVNPRQKKRPKLMKHQGFTRPSSQYSRYD